MNDLKVGKTISYALRHNPKQYNLTPDSEGYVLIEDLLRGINNKTSYEITLKDIERIMANSDKKRYEISQDMIRATYGHSKVHIKKDVIKPPETLYHGTTKKAWNKIKTEGLKSMERQFVHLSEDLETAIRVAKRRTENPVIIEVNSSKAFSDGVKFFEGNDTTWLSEEIAARYLSKK